MSTHERQAKAVGRTALLAALALALGACEGVWVPATAPIDRTLGFTFDSNAGTLESATLDRDELLGDLDISDEALVDAVDIQRVRLTLEEGEGNEAAEFTLTFSYQAANFTESLDLVVADLDGEPVEALIASTLRAVEADILAILAEDPGAPFSITVDGLVSGIEPSAARLVIDATLDVRMTVTTFLCEDIGLGPFGPGAPCQIDL